MHFILAASACKTVQYWPPADTLPVVLLHRNLQVYVLILCSALVRCTFDMCAVCASVPIIQYSLPLALPLPLML